MIVYVLIEFYYEYDSNSEEILGVFASRESAQRMAHAYDMAFELEEAYNNRGKKYQNDDYSRMHWEVFAYEVEE